MKQEESLFKDFEGPVHQDGETFKEYKDRLKRENNMLSFYRKRGRRHLKGDSIGSQRRRLMMKRMKRRGNLD